MSIIMGIVNSIIKEATPKAVQLGVQLLTRYAGFKLLTHRAEEEGDSDEILRRVDIILDGLDINQMLEESITRDSDNEIDRINGLLNDAEALIKQGEWEKGRKLLETGLNITECNRCKRGLEQIIVEDNESALEKIHVLKRLIPSYMEVLREEPKLMAIKSDNGTEANSDKGTEGKPCLPCIARVISTVCNGDRDCIEGAAKIQKEDPTADTSVIIRRITEFAANITPDEDKG